jgi:hypothetical protein
LFFCSSMEESERGWFGCWFARLNKQDWGCVWWRKESKEFKRDGWICRGIGEYCSRLLLASLNWRKEQRRDSMRWAMA